VPDFKSIKQRGSTKINTSGYTLACLLFFGNIQWAVYLMVFFGLILIDY
jgi:hypothetical protein